MNPTDVPPNVPVHIDDPALAISRGGVIVSPLRVRFGRLEVTRRELVYFQFSRWLTALGLIGVLFMRKATGRRMLTLELAKIATIKRGTHLRTRRVMDVTMVDGTQHRFLVDRFDEVAAGLHAAMGGRGLALAA